jgi:hypothetical protein
LPTNRKPLRLKAASKFRNDSSSNGLPQIVHRTDFLPVFFDGPQIGIRRSGPSSNE